MIELRNIGKVYSSRRRKTQALSGVNLTLGESGMVCLLGESGCGKTTLLNILGTLDSPTSGDILVDGKSLVAMRESERQAYRATQIGFIFQDLNLIEDLTVRDNLLMVCDKDDLETKHRDTLRKLEIDEFADKFPKELSGGQRQRVAIARAIVKGSRILLCDEPTGSLDPDNAVMIFETLKEISRERLVVVVSHDVATASKYADRIIRLHKGQVQSDTEAEQENASEQNGIQGENTHAISARPKAKQRVRGLFGLSLRYLKCKPARLAIMAAISVLIFTLLSVVSAISSYDKRTLAGKTMADHDVNYLLAQRQYEGHLVYKAPNSIERKTNSVTVDWTDESIEKAAATMNCTVDPVYSIYYMASLGNTVATQLVNPSFFSTEIRGVVRMTPDLAERYGFELYGELPVASDDVVIGGYTYEMYRRYGYLDDDIGERVGIHSPQDMLGKQINLNEFDGTETLQSVFTVTGVLDTHFNAERYDCMKEYDDDALKTRRREFNAINGGCAHNFLYISDAFFDEVVKPYKEKHGGKAFIRVYNSVTDMSRDFIDLEDITEQVGGKIFYAPGIDENSDAVICDAYDLFGEDEISEITDEAIRQAVNAIAAEKATALVYHSTVFGFESSVPFGGVYCNPDHNTENVMYVQNNVRDKIFAEYELFERDQIDGIRSVVSRIMIPASGRKANKRLLRYHEKPLALSTETPIKFRGYSQSIYQADNLQYVFSNEVMNAIDHADHMFEPIAKYAWYVFWGVAALTVLVIYLYFSALLSSREKDVGVLRTNGYTKWEIALLFIFEALILSAIFIVLAVIISSVGIAVGASVFRNKYDFLFTPISFTFTQVGMIFGFQLLFATLGILLPLLMLLRKKPMQIINAGK